MAARLLIFTIIVVCEAFDFQGYHGAREMGMGIRQVKIPQNTFVTKNKSLFFLNKYSLNFASFWLISRAMKKFILKNICLRPCCFYGWADFQKSLLHYSRSSTPRNNFSNGSVSLLWYHRIYAVILYWNLPKALYGIFIYHKYLK